MSSFVVFGGNGVPWITSVIQGPLTGDVFDDPVTTTLITVTGLSGHVLPSLSTGYLNWTGSAWALTASPASGAQYIELALDASTPQARRLAAGSNITLTDAGAGSTLTIASTLSGTGVVGGAVNGFNFFGDGSDGTATCDGGTAVAGMSRSGSIYTQTRDCYFANLTVNNGVSINTNGYRAPFVNGTLTNNGTIHANGVVGLAATGGAGGGQGAVTPTITPTTRVGGGGAGAAANGTGAAATTNAMGAIGGAGNASVAGVTTAPLAQYSPPRDVITALDGYTRGVTAGVVTFLAFNGGGGGGGSGTGSGLSGQDPGGGGGGGGVLILSCRVLVGNGTISANGGNGYDDNGSPHGCGTGGGGGGYVALAVRDQTGWTGTVQALGGVGGALAAAQPGHNGNAGTVITFVV